MQLTQDKPALLSYDILKLDFILFMINICIPPGTYLHDLLTRVSVFIKFADGPVYLTVKYEYEIYKSGHELTT